jgi:hypothetical protein
MWFLCDFPPGAAAFKRLKTLRLRPSPLYMFEMIIISISVKPSSFFM